MGAGPATIAGVWVNLRTRPPAKFKAKPDRTGVAGILAGTTGDTLGRQTPRPDLRPPVQSDGHSGVKRPFPTGTGTFAAKGAGPVAEIQNSASVGIAQDDVLRTGRDTVTAACALVRKPCDGTGRTNCVIPEVCETPPNEIPAC